VHFARLAGGEPTAEFVNRLRELAAGRHA